MRQPGARLVIIGAGIVGCCAAYHLTRMGWRDVSVLDKGPLPENDGSTSHAPGGVVVLGHNQTLTRMAKYSRDLYVNLPEIEHERNLANPLGMPASADRRFVLTRSIRQLCTGYPQGLLMAIFLLAATAGSTRYAIPHI